MEQRSAVFDGARKILEMATARDPQRWFFGLIGGGPPGVDALEGLNDFTRFADTALRRGPVDAKDVALVNEMIFMQQRDRRPQVLHDSATGLQWEWDGSPVAHLVASALGREEAKRLGDERLLDTCAALEHRALSMVQVLFEAAFGDVARRAGERARAPAQQHDVGRALADLERSLPEARRMGEEPAH